MSVEIAKLFYKLELNFHRGNHVDTNACLKQQLGTNENTCNFFHLLKVNRCKNGIAVKIFNIKIIKYMFGIVKNSNLFFLIKTSFKIIAQLILYSWDLIKDVYFLIIYAQFFPILRNPFESFGFQMFFILLLSILIPNVLNIATIIVGNSEHLPSKGKLILVLFPFVSQSAIGYAINKMQMVIEKLRRQYSNLKIEKNCNILIDYHITLQHEAYKLSKLLLKLRTNEGIFESSVQAIILIFAIAINLR